MSNLVLGSGWGPRPQPDPVDPSEDLLVRVYLAIEGLQATFAQLPAPVIHLAPQDFSDIVTAVQGLNGPAGPTAAQIAEAIKDALDVPAPVEPDPVLPALLEALEKLDFRMRGSAGGGAGSLSLPNDANRLLGIVSTTAPAGAFWYQAGASGTVALTGSKKVQTVTAHCTTAGSFTINAGDTITIPANSQFSASFLDGKLTDPTFVFTGTDAYYLDGLS